MRKSIKKWLLPLSMLFMLGSCDSCNPPTVTTSDTTSITSSAATAGGNVTDEGDAPVTERGVCLSTNPGTSIADKKPNEGVGIGPFSVPLTGLNPGVKYFLKAYAINKYGTGYGAEEDFNTLSNLPTVITNATIAAVTSSTASSGGTITSDGGGAITGKGVCWSTTSNPTIALTTKTSDGTGSSSFTSNLIGLTPGVKYYVKAFATNSAGTAYGSEISFTTTAIPPSVTTTVASAITSATATSGGNVTADGGSAVTAKGVCWSTTTGPTISNSKTSDGAGIGIFNSSLTSLTANTTYFVRAYATNSVGTSYGNEITFKASGNPPTVTTTSASSIGTTTATSGGNVTSDGGSAVTARGVCWSTTSNPTTSNSKTTDAGTTGIYTSSITGLTSGTTYFVRAYATNSNGTAYGNEVTFTPIATYVLTIIRDGTGSGTVTSNVGLLNCGIYCSTSYTSGTVVNLTVAENSTSTFSGWSGGNCTGTLRTCSVTMNSNMTVTVTFSASPPTVTTTSVSSITSATAASGGNVTSATTVTAKGVCWSTNSGPTISNFKTTDGTGTGSFTSSLTSLTANTTYYVRAYATNSAGTVYGNEVSFTSLSVPPNLTVTDSDGNIYATVTIGNQIWMKENLKTTKFNDGTAIQGVSDNNAWFNLTTPGYCWYDNASKWKDILGALYNWYTVNTGKLCPIGWHVPSDAEWSALTIYLGGTTIAGGKLKLTGINPWPDTNIGATNESGFSAVPGGGRYFTGTFSNGGSDGSWWSSSEASISLAWSRYVSYNNTNIGRLDGDKRHGFSIRCIKN